MYENENKNGLGNENMEHRDVPETTVNWTIPGDGRSRQRQNTQSQNTEGQYSQGQGSQGPSEQHAPYQGYQGGGDKHRNHSNKGRFAKRVAGITAAAVLFGTVSGGVMTGVNYLGNRLTGAYGTAGTSAETQAQNQIGQAAPVNAQASGNKGATAVSAVTDVSGIVENAMPSIVAINDTMTVDSDVNNAL